MKVIITKKEEFSSKAGQAYVKCSYVALDGSNGEIFTTAEKFNEYKLPPAVYTTVAELLEFAETVTTVNVDFDSKGKLVSVSV